MCTWIYCVLYCFVYVCFIPICSVCSSVRTTATGWKLHSICSCSKAVYKPVWHIPLLSVQWINFWWWTDELAETCRVSCQNKFVKLVHLVGFIIKKLVTVFWNWLEPATYLRGRTVVGPFRPSIWFPSWQVIKTVLFIVYSSRQNGYCIVHLMRGRKV